MNKQIQRIKNRKRKENKNGKREIGYREEKNKINKHKKLIQHCEQLSRQSEHPKKYMD